jgi:hypothetical protein
MLNYIISVLSTNEAKWISLSYPILNKKAVKSSYKMINHTLSLNDNATLNKQIHKIHSIRKTKYGVSRTPQVLNTLDRSGTKSEMD